jgi:site-specific recombinase XerC
MKAPFQRVEAGLYVRDGLYYARVRDGGRRTWRGTGTRNLTQARKVLAKWREEQVLKRHGIESPVAALARNRLTVNEVLDAYMEAGFPTPKMKPKAPATVRRETMAMRPLRDYFGKRAAVTLTLADCDGYRDWRTAGGYVTTYTRKGETVTQRCKGGVRSVDLELIVLSNALRLAVRRQSLKANPLAGRQSYTDTTKIRHCRECAPTPEGLAQIEHWLRVRGNHDMADLVCFLAFTGLRIGEALRLDWESVDWAQGVLHVQRLKRGYNPFVPMLPDLVELLRGMQKRARSHLLFPSPFNTEQSREQCGVNRRLAAACKALGLPHATPHGLRSYFVTQARQSGLTDAEIAMLIGDKTGPSIIASTYGDLRPDHLLAQARRIRHAVAPAGDSVSVIPEVIPALPKVAPCCTVARTVSQAA